MPTLRYSNLFKNRRLPPIGLRILKSAAGVFLCCLLDQFRGGQGIVFYSQLAVLWCMQDYTRDTILQAKQRILGTVIGAVYGLLVLLGAQVLPLSGSPGRELLRDGMTSLFIILILYTTVVIKKKQASYFSCVVFLSIVVNHMADANPWLFVWNRLLDTLIGIAIGVFVNCFSLPRWKNQQILFVSGLDDTLLSDRDNLSGYSRVELNRMIESGAKFTVSTMRTPASLMEPLRDIHLKLPVIVMDGAALYDLQKNRYLMEYVISGEYSGKIIRFLEEEQQPYFANVIMDDLLVIYYQETQETVYNGLIQELGSSPYRNYVKRRLPENEPVVYFMMIDHKERMQELYEKLKSQEMAGSLKILFYDSTDYPGYSYIKIYNHNAVKENMLAYLRKHVEAEQVVTFGTIEGRYTHLIEPGDSNQVVKLMKNEFEPVKWPWKRRKEGK